MKASRVVRATRIDPAVADRVRATVAGLQQAVDPSFTAAQFAEQALTAWCEHMEAEYNDGRGWPPLGSEGVLRPGARLNSPPDLDRGPRQEGAG